MNKRIDQLWAQALDLAVPETYSRLSYSQVLKIKQVFAELIVRECARLADNSPQYIDGREILEHFGVEE